MTKTGPGPNKHTHTLDRAGRSGRLDEDGQPYVEYEDDATRPSGDEVLDSAYRMSLIQIEHDGEVINRLTQALRVANHSPHDQAGEPNEGFPVCSVCGAIQTGPSGADVQPGEIAHAKKRVAAGLSITDRERQALAPDVEGLNALREAVWALGFHNWTPTGKRHPCDEECVGCAAIARGNAILAANAAAGHAAEVERESGS